MIQYIFLRVKESKADTVESPSQKQWNIEYEMLIWTSNISVSSLILYTQGHLSCMYLKNTTERVQENCYGEQNIQSFGQNLSVKMMQGK